MLIFHTKLTPGRRNRSASATRSAAWSALALDARPSTSVRSSPSPSAQRGGSRGATAWPGRPERWGVWGAISGPPMRMKLHMPQRLDDIQARGAPGGIERGQRGRDDRELERLRQHGGDDENLDHEAARGARRRRQLDPDGGDGLGQRHTEHDAGDSAQHAEHEALQHEHRHHAAPPRAERHDGADLPGALEDGHGHGVGDAEHDHDGDDQREHREDAAEELAHLVVAQRQVLPRLDLEVEAPVADQPLEALADGGGVVRRVQEQHDRLHLAALEVEDALGLGQADPEEAIVVRLLARLPHAPHLDGQRVDRARLGGGEQGEVVARLHAEGPGEPDAEGDAARIARRQLLAVDDHRQRREIHLALGYDAGADERRRGVAGGDESGEAEARGDHLDVLDPPQLVAQRRVVGDQVVERREVALFGVAPALDLDVADLAADGGLANAVIDGVHEAAEHDDGGGPEAHRGQRDQRAAPVAEDVAESQFRVERHGYRLLNSLSIAAASGAAGYRAFAFSQAARAAAGWPDFL